MSLLALPWVVAPVGGALIGFALGRAATRLLLRPSTAAKVMPSLTGGLLGTPLAQLAPDAQEITSRVIRPSVEAGLRSLISSAWFLHEIRQAASRIVDSISSLPMARVLERVNARAFLVDRLFPAVSRDESRRSIAQAAGAAAGDSVATLASDDALQRASLPLGRLLPTVVERLIDWLESAEMRDTMAGRARELLPRILEKLNVMQRFLVSAGQFDKRIDEKMPEIINETLEALERLLRDPVQQRAMRDRIISAIRDWRESNESRADVSLLVNDLVDGFLGRLREPAARESAYLSLEAFFTAGEQTLGAFLLQRLGLGDREIADSLANQILAWLSRPDAAASASAWVAERACTFLGDNISRPLGAVLGIDTGRKERIDAFLIGAAARIASAPGSRPAAAARRWAGALGSILGLLIGLLVDVLRLLGIS